MAFLRISQLVPRIRVGLLLAKPYLSTSAAVQSKVRESAFWKKKFMLAMKNRDADKDGFISRKDFYLLVQRYEDLGYSPEQTKKIKNTFQQNFETWGLENESTALTYEQFSENYMKGLERAGEFHPSLFKEMFETVDMNGDGKITFDEWVKHNKAMGIDQKHARASFDAMDADGDGEVSVEEFSNYHREFFFSTEDKLKSSILYGPL